MSDTTTAHLALVKIEVGGSADTWGDKLNGNMDLIDAAVDARLPKSGGTATALDTTSTVKDADGTERPLGFRGIPSVAKAAAYVLALADIGRCVDITTGGVTIPTNATVPFPVGDGTVQIYNNSGSNQTLTPAAGVTLRQAGTANTGARTIAAYGWLTLRKVATDTWIAAGAGIS